MLCFFRLASLTFSTRLVTVCLVISVNDNETTRVNCQQRVPSQLKKPFVGEGRRGSHEQGDGRDLILVFLIIYAFYTTPAGILFSLLGTLWFHNVPTDVYWVTLLTEYAISQFFPQKTFLVRNFSVILYAPFGRKNNDAQINISWFVFWVYSCIPSSGPWKHRL